MLLAPKLKSNGHNLRELFDTINNRNPSKWSFNEIQEAIINCLDAFANQTRYFYLDYLSEKKRPFEAEPITVWYKEVCLKILEKHTPKLTKKIKKDKKLNEFFYTLLHREDGESISSLEEVFFYFDQCRALQKYSRLYVFQIARLLAERINVLSAKAHQAGIEEMVFLNEFYWLFNQLDNYILKRATWSTLKP